MYWGQFIDTASRVDRTCFYEPCGAVIPAKTRHMALVARNRKGDRFTRHFDTTCFIPYILEARETRAEYIAANRKGGPGPRGLGLDPDTKAARTTLTQRISQARRQLILALVQRKPHRIRTARLHLASKLELMASGAYGPGYKFPPGDDLLRLLDAGADPTLSRADFGACESLEDIINVLRGPVEPAVEPITLIGSVVIAAQDVLGAKKSLLMALRIGRGQPKALRALATALESVPEFAETPPLAGLGEALAAYLHPVDLERLYAATAASNNHLTAAVLVSAALRVEMPQ